MLRCIRICRCICLRPEKPAKRLFCVLFGVLVLWVGGVGGGVITFNALAAISRTSCYAASVVYLVSIS